ncbi:spermatogenesis-associated protein 17 [Gaertneriomyces sp. JEL0708]|nr:spermatogenesis-associated protein 17 [Gaertneriomyces sp. JEL0708]
MALSLARLLRSSPNDMVDDFFERAKDAEANYERETAAAVKIQTAWRGSSVRQNVRRLAEAALILQRCVRGYLTRVELAKRFQELHIAALDAYYNASATRIQCVYRGYISRKKAFDYYKRKRWITDLAERMEKKRQAVEQQQQEKIAQWREQQERDEAKRKERLAGNLHHLVGTKGILGVWSAGPGWKRAKMTEPSSEGRVKLPPLYIPEETLRSNATLKDWIRQHTSHAGKLRKKRRFKRVVGGRCVHLKCCPRGETQLPLDAPDPKCEETENSKDSIVDNSKPQSNFEAKTVSGPFLPRHKLHHIIHTPFHPSLRVQTSYSSVHESELEERQLKKWLNVSEKPFVPTGRIRPGDHELGYLSEREPYQVVKYERGGSYAKLPDKPRFRNLVRPLRAFDDLALEEECECF